MKHLVAVFPERGTQTVVTGAGLDEAVNVVSLARDREIFYRHEEVQRLSAEVARLSTELRKKTSEQSLGQALMAAEASSSGPRVDPAAAHMSRILDKRRTALLSGTVGELHEICRAHRISGYSSLTKAFVIERILEKTQAEIESGGLWEPLTAENGVDSVRRQRPPEPPTLAQERYIRAAARRQGMPIPPEILSNKDLASQWLQRHGDWRWH
jgi:hypothetical protein